MRGPQAMMRTPLMMSHPPDPAQTNEIVAWRRLAAAGVWSSVNRRPSIHSAYTQVPGRDQQVSGQESTAVPVPEARHRNHFTTLTLQFAVLASPAHYLQ